MFFALVSHILIDLSDPSGELGRKISEMLAGLCNSMYSNESLGLEIFKCNESLIQVLRRENNLFVDVVGEEKIFDRLAEVLPVQRVIVRLVERGIPSRGE